MAIAASGNLERGFPTVATEAVMQQMLTAEARVNEVGIVMATSPRQQFGGANADTASACCGRSRRLRYLI